MWTFIYIKKHVLWDSKLWTSFLWWRDLYSISQGHHGTLLISCLPLSTYWTGKSLSCVLITELLSQNEMKLWIVFTKLGVIFHSSLTFHHLQKRILGTRIINWNLILNNNFNTVRLLESAQQLLQTGRVVSTNHLAKRQLLVEARVPKSHSLDLNQVKKCPISCVVC